MSTGGERMAKRSIGNLMRKKLSDVTNSQSHSLGQNKLSTQQDNHPLDTLLTDNHCIQQLLKERVTLTQLLAERDEMIELSGAELQKLRADIKKLQLQNWNLAHSNTQILAELNLGRERIKTLQHEISWRAALLKGKTADLREGDENAEQPSTKASNDEQHSYMNRRRIRSRCKTTDSSTASTKNASKDKVKDNSGRLRRHSATFKAHEHEPLEYLFEIEDAKYLVIESGPNTQCSSIVKDEIGEISGLRNAAPRSSFGRPMRRAVEKVQSYKEIPLNVKLRRLE